MQQIIQDSLMTLIHALIVTVIPLLTGIAVKYFTLKQKNEKTRGCLDELKEAVWAAVAQTSNSYVDELKKTDTFTKEAQTIALKQAKQTAISALTPATKEYLQETYKDLQSLLEAKIEEAVRSQKNE